MILGFSSSSPAFWLAKASFSDFGQREDKGFESSATWQASRDIQLFGNVSHLLAKNLRTSFSFDTVAEEQYGIGFKGAPITGVPDWLSTFGVNYTRTNMLADRDSLDLRVTGQYTGHQYTTYELGGSDYAHIASFPGLSPLDYAGCTGPRRQPRLPCLCALHPGRW